MVVLLINVTFDVWRSNFLNGESSVPMPYMLGVTGHIQPVAEKHLDIMTYSTMRVEHEIRVDYGLDIRTGDDIKNIKRFDDSTPWPIPNGGADIWRILLGYDVSPGLMNYRVLQIGRYIAGGPAPR